MTIIPAKCIETKTYTKEYNEGDNQQHYNQEGKDCTTWSLKGSLQKQSDSCGETQGCANSDYCSSGYAVETNKNCGNRNIYDNGLQRAFDDDLYNRKADDLDVWGVNVETSDFVVRSDPGAEINDRVLDEIETAISDLISNAVTYAIQNSLKGCININKGDDRQRQTERPEYYNEGQQC